VGGWCAFISLCSDLPTLANDLLQAPRNLFLSGGHELSKAQLKLFRMSENSSSLPSEHASAAEMAVTESQHVSALPSPNEEAQPENDGTPAASSIPRTKLPPRHSELSVGSLAQVLEDASDCSSEGAEVEASCNGESEVPAMSVAVVTRGSA
jgi:hypothetical protein